MNHKSQKILKNFLSSFETKRFNSNITLEFLKQKFQPIDKPNYLEQIEAKNPFISKLKRSAILVPISIKEETQNGNKLNKTYFTFTKRSENLKSFKGQVCFIGGKRDEDDVDDSFTALREAKEEANIESTDLVILARLCPVITFNQNLVTPVIAYFNKSNFTPTLNHKEVDFMFELPTERFLSNRNHEMSCIKNKNGEYFVHYFKDNVCNREITTWGFTVGLKYFFLSYYNLILMFFS